MESMTLFFYDGVATKHWLENFSIFPIKFVGMQ